MIQFRPHHFLCTLGFEGKGYSPEFVRGFQAIADQLRAGTELADEIEIEVVAATDSICAPCPNRQGTLCATEPKIQALDRAHEAVLGFTPGTVIRWGDAKKRINRHMSDERFEQACAPCSWKPLGLCKSALQKNRAEQGE